MIPLGGADLRTAELAANVAGVRSRLAAACAAANRDPGEVTLIGVTKTYPTEDVVRLAALGVTDIGENRDQEASTKAAAVASAGEFEITWHFIGRLQRNKCRSVVRYADVVHSVDNVPLALALSEAASRYRTTPLDVLVQVSLDGDLARGGAIVETGQSDRALKQVLAAVEAAPDLRLRGLMAVAPLECCPDDAFCGLHSLLCRVRDDYPHATWLSAGMSGDVESAIAHGSTHVRVGHAMLGKRPLLR